jgi:DNA-binding NarL/FixJ family response regulator
VACGTFIAAAALGLEPGFAVVLAADGDDAGLAGSLERGGYRVTVAASLDDVGSSTPELVVVRCGRLSGRTFRTLRELRGRLEASAIVLCSPSRAGTGVDEALAAGADAVVQAGELEDLLFVAVGAARHGYVLRPRAPAAANVARPFSARERQALSMVTLGFSNREIAQTLHLSESTVKSHLSSSFAKLGVRTRAEATARILADRGAAAGVLAIPGDHERLSFSRQAPKA